MHHKFEGFATLMDDHQMTNNCLDLYLFWIILLNFPQDIPLDIRYVLPTAAR